MDVAHPSQLAAPLVRTLLARMERDERLLGLTLGGSAVLGATDEHSDLDLVVVCEDDAHAELLATAPAWAARLGPLLVCFTGEHVGEPRLLIALYGPPLLHVDLKLVALADADRRVEDAIVLWRRDGRLDEALGRRPAAWPDPDPQWIEDRFWVWVHYGAGKIARGELFECLELLTLLRSAALGPMIAVRAGLRPQGVRRVESGAPDHVPALAATIGDHSAAGCARALCAAVELYHELRGPLEVERRTGAEDHVTAFLETVARSAGA